MLNEHSWSDSLAPQFVCHAGIQGFQKTKIYLLKTNKHDKNALTQESQKTKTYKFK